MFCVFGFILFLRRLFNLFQNDNFTHGKKPSYNIQPFYHKILDDIASVFLIFMMKFIKMDKKKNTFLLKI